MQTNWGYKAEWEQPIINQPEVGYLGFLVTEFEGVLHFLMQAKIEPGNVNNVQLSPTLQATRSNFTRVHEGRTPAYLEYFQKAKPYQILVDQLQSEQGARFLRKRNRNIVVWLEEEIEVLVINQPPVLDFIVNQNANQYFSYVGFGPKQGFNVAKVINPEPVRNANQKVADVASKYSNVSMFDVYETYSENGKVRITHDDEILYFDDDHLTYEGTLISKQDLFLRLQSMIEVDP